MTVQTKPSISEVINSLQQERKQAFESRDQHREAEKTSTIPNYHETMAYMYQGIILGITEALGQLYELEANI